MPAPPETLIGRLERAAENARATDEPATVWFLGNRFVICSCGTVHQRGEDRCGWCKRSLQ
jgi:hypothetical protein